ncbi:helix-turn-helix domain-containing protein [Nocardioides bigeumensis]|uniref:TetR/AcrR family transcriptional regulator n=1 Tax=Nocardioides bigeumensis TaxID=433657 RepID=A0ABN2Y4C3_9ACTN
MTRTYQQKKRAEQQEKTRLRIVEAAVALHGELGPARTTMSAVAERAGVQRNTLYRHFPDERALLHACSAHHVAQHPLPDPADWLDIDDPVARSRHGLRLVYAHWEADEAMTSHVVRDAEVHPLVGEVSRLRLGGPRAAIREALLTAWPEGQRSPEVTASIDLALSFRTWQTLVRGSGLSSDAAADLMAAAIACAAHRP